MVEGLVTRGALELGESGESCFTESHLVIFLDGGVCIFLYIYILIFTHFQILKFSFALGLE